MNKKISNTLLSLLEIEPKCLECIFYVPELGHGNFPGPRGYCKKYVVHRYVHEGYKCKQFCYRGL